MQEKSTAYEDIFSSKKMLGFFERKIKKKRSIEPI